MLRWFMLLYVISSKCTLVDLWKLLDNVLSGWEIEKKKKKRALLWPCKPLEMVYQERLYSILRCLVDYYG